MPPTGQQVGIDVGLATFATRSDGQAIGQAIANPRFFRQEEHARKNTPWRKPKESIKWRWIPTRPREQRSPNREYGPNRIWMSKVCGKR